MTFSLEESFESLEQLEDRLFAIRDMARKYNIAPDQLGAFLEQKQERLSLLQILALK